MNDDQFYNKIEGKTLLQQLQISASLKKKYDEITSGFAYDLTPYYTVITKHQSGNTYGYSNWDRFEVEEEGIRFFVEVNTACHCHPEYETKEFYLPFESLKVTPEALDKEMTDFEKKCAEIEARNAAEANRIASEKVKAAQLEADKRKYEELKQKFEGK